LHDYVCFRAILAESGHLEGQQRRMESGLEEKQPRGQYLKRTLKRQYGFFQT